MAITVKYECRLCHKVYVMEHAYMNHECKRMKREREIKTPTGQAAWHFYQNWMREQKRMPPSADAFMESNSFRTFMNFAEFVKKVNLPLPNKFIWLMNIKKYQPSIWTRDEVYSQYLTFIDTKMPPVEQAKSSINTILDYADSHDIDPSEVFNVINPNELIHLVRLRKLSPWLLLASRKFSVLFTKLNTEQQSILETLIQPDIWADKIATQSADMKIIKAYVGELGI